MMQHTGSQKSSGTVLKVNPDPTIKAVKMEAPVLRLPYLRTALRLLKSLCGRALVGSPYRDTNRGSNHCMKRQIQCNGE